MEDYAYNGWHMEKNGQYFAMPQRCQLELCRLPEWQLHGYRERFSSSSFADSESEEEMSKRRAGKESMGPPPVPPKIRRGGAFRGRGRGHSQRFAERQYDQSMMPPQRHRFSHSSSDDEVFLDAQPMEPLLGPPPPMFSRHPPPFPQDFDDFVPPPPFVHRSRDPRSKPFYKHPRSEQERFSEEITNRPLIRSRYHSMPAEDRDLSARDLGPFRGRSVRKGQRSSSAGRVPAGSEESSEEESQHRVVSGDDEFEYLYRYGYCDRRESPKGIRPSSGTSSGSDKSYSHAAGRRGGNTAGRGRGQTGNRGGFPAGRGSANKWSGVNKAQPGLQTSWGKGTTSPSKKSPSKKVIKHQPLPQPKPANVHHLQNINQGIHSLANVERKTPTVNLSEMSIAEKLHRFMLFVRHENSARINDIQTVENAITGCHLDLKTMYETEDVGVYQGRHTFSGKLTLSGIFLARAVGQVKKELKHECYKLALQVLKSKEIPEILKQHDIGITAIRTKFEECSTPDTDSTVSDAVVNLASAAPIAVAMETVATAEERWHDFTNYLKGLNPEMGNNISRIEMALSGSRCGLERLYTDTTIVDPLQNKPGFQGSLSLGGILQAQAQGVKKKEAKQKTYDLAFERFTTLEMVEILKGVEPQNVEEFKKEGKGIRVIIKEISTPEQIKKFELFIDRIKDSSVREGPVTLLDLTANQLQLLITCMYKKMEDAEINSLCQLFVGDILISEGEGRQKKEAQADAYCKAYDMLISTPLDTIMSESHRLNKEELEGPDVQDVVVKGQMKKEESNLPRLRNQYPNLEEVMSDKTSADLVIVEHQDWIHDRKRHAFCILQNSAIMNIMVLKWGTDIETGFFTCRVQLQGEELGMAKAHSRQQARNLAAADALFKMYERHPVLRIITADPSGNWLTKAQLVERMKDIPQSEFEEVDAEIAQNELNRKTANEEGSEKAELTEEEKEERKLQRRLRVVAMKAVEEFQQRGDVLDELVFAPDLPIYVRRYLPTNVNKKGLRSAQYQKDGKISLIVHFRTRVDQLVSAMQERGVTKMNRFLLVEDRSELPCHADIAEEIEAARTLSRQDRMAARTAPKAAEKESRDAAVGNSLNGSLFEETMEGFVTAQSSVLADANSSMQPPKVQSTPQTTPAKKTTPSRKQTTPAEEVYAKFARAMMASGIGQTLVPMESSTPVSNILVNPPKSDNVGNSSGAPVIKNILISPPKVGGMSVTLSSPMKNLSVSSSASSSFPQPDFSSLTSPVKGGLKPPVNTSKSSSSASTLSPNSTDTSSGQSQSYSRHSRSSNVQSKAPTASGSQQTKQQWSWQQPHHPPPPVNPGRQAAATAPVQTSATTVRQNTRTAAGQNFTAGSSAQNSYPSYNNNPPSNPTVYPNTNTNSGGYYNNQYQVSQDGGSWQQPGWSSTDPSAAHTIQMSPAASQYGGYQNVYPAQQDGYATAMHVENEVPASVGHGRKWNQWNQHNPV